MQHDAMQPRTNILMATVLSPHGVRGWVKVFWHGENPLLAATYKTLFDKTGRAFVVAEQRMQGKALALKFTGTDDRTAAEALKGTELFIPRAALPPPKEGEYYHVDLIGLAAQTAAGDHLGIVKSIQNFGAGDVMEIEKLNNEIEFLPFTTDIIQRVNFEAEMVVVTPPIIIE